MKTTTRQRKKMSAGAVAALNVSSKAIESHKFIPVRYTCEGENISPPLDIAGIPEQSRSLVLIVEDPDAIGATWLHWMVFNIPPVNHLDEDDIPGEQAVNDFGQCNYGGPCPPSGTHRYYFKVYALDEVLPMSEGVSRTEVMEAMEDHVLAYGEIVCLYRKRHGATGR
jgi:Raf kinase inhibitor-like YbhB/YbcL family protein